MKRTTKSELAAMGIDLRDVDQPIGTLSGGERQCVAIARAVYFGARVLILDEPTAALGVKQSGVVLRYIAKARDRGLGVVFMTHNPHHAYPVGDRFMVLRRGRSMGDFPKSEMLARGAHRDDGGRRRLADLAHELQRTMGDDSSVVEELRRTCCDRCSSWWRSCVWGWSAWAGWVGCTRARSCGSRSTTPRSR